jgi:hypothetical protein
MQIIPHYQMQLRLLFFEKRGPARVPLNFKKGITQWKSNEAARSPQPKDRRHRSPEL